MERRRKAELKELEEIRLDLRGIRKDVSEIRCVEEIWARIIEGKTGKMEERERLVEGGRNAREKVETGRRRQGRRI